MKKHTRIGLLILVTLMLTLALTIPGLADDPITYCQLQFPAYTPGSSAQSSTYNLKFPAPGEYTVMEWIDGKLINVCKGSADLGEPVHGNGKLTFFTYEDLGSLDVYVVTEDYTYASDETYTGLLTAYVYDTDGTAYPVTDWIAKIYPDGSYEFYKEYTP